MTDSKEWSSFPPAPIVWTQLIIKILFPLYAAGHQKYAKMLCQSGNVASHHPTLIKKTSAIVLLVSAQ
ncbi:hypothetical protein [Pedobacter miscanthi]|uniref:hypothetical protein n=1 Tax=Pedobacter miscanthi TaxID=2259170 RepID=UPI0029316E78|nr:hypothetical protein [Pedobacter miscanthi]